MNKHGGPRPGSGRKPLPAGQRKIMMSFKFTPELVEFLKTVDNKTAAIEKAVERSPGFKRWKADN